MLKEHNKWDKKKWRPPSFPPFSVTLPIVLVVPSVVRDLPQCMCIYIYTSTLTHICHLSFLAFLLRTVFPHLIYMYQWESDLVNSHLFLRVILTANSY